MFDKLIESCNKLASAFKKKAELETMLADTNSEIETLKNQVRSATTITYPKGFKQTLYSYKGEIYLIQYSQVTGSLTAEKVNFSQPHQV